MDYSKQIANKLISYIEDKEYRYTFDRENGVIRMNFNCKGKLSSVRLLVDVRSCYFICYGCIDMKASEDHRKEVAEYLTRANYGLSFGNFELDMRDGEIRYKMTVDCDHCILSDEMISSALYIPIQSFERYGDELVKVIFGLTSAADAIRIAEANND